MPRRAISRRPSTKVPETNIIIDYDSSRGDLWVEKWDDSGRSYESITDLDDNCIPLIKLCKSNHFKLTRVKNMLFTVVCDFLSLFHYKPFFKQICILIFKI